jgi:hypothetical protein
MKEFLELYAPVLAILGVFGPPMAYFFGGKMAQRVALKKENAAAKQTDADANSAIAKAYREFVEDHNLQMGVLRDEVKELRTSNMSISGKQTDILLLYAKEQKKSFELENKNTELALKIEYLEAQLDLLTKAKAMVSKSK